MSQRYLNLLNENYVSAVANIVNDNIDVDVNDACLTENDDA